MKQDEVDLIYNYLHENYEYRDGELINLKTNKFIGGIHTDKHGRLHFNACINIRGKKFIKNISHFIWLYHNKELPKFITYFDNNCVNLKIENLKNNLTRSETSVKISSKNTGVCKSNLNEKKPYFVQVMINRKSIRLATCDTKQEAKNIYKHAKLLMENGFMDKILLKEKLREIYPENVIKSKANKHGLKGVLIQPNGKYQSNIRRKNRTIYLGTYNTPEEAHEAYLKAKEEYKQCHVKQE